MRIEEVVARKGDEVLYLDPHDRKVIASARPPEDMIIRVTHRVYVAGKERIPSA